MEQQADLELLKDIPGFKIILRAVMKDQMKYLAEQLSKHAGEETLIVTASVADGTSSHLGSHGGIGFVEHRDEIKSQFLGHCIKNSQARPVPVHMHTTPVNEISPDHATQPALLYAGQPPLLYAAQPSVLHAGQPVHQKPDQGSLLRRPPSGIHSVKFSKTTSGSNTIQQSDKHGLVRKMPSSETVSSNPPPLKQARMCTSSINETDYATADIRIKMEDQCDKEENISRTDYTSRHTSQIVTGEQPSTSQANFSRSVDQPDISDLSYQIKIEPIEDLDVYDMSGQFECSADEADGNNDISTATETDTEMNAEESNEIMGQNQSDSNIYEKVRDKLKLAEDESDLQTDEGVEAKRKRRKTRKLIDGESPPPPKQPASTSPKEKEPLLPEPPPRLALSSTGCLSSSSNSLSKLSSPGRFRPDVQSQQLVLEPQNRTMSGITQILTTLEKMKEEQQELRRIVQILVSRGPSASTVNEPESQLPDGVLFPMSTTHEMDNLDDILREPGNLSSVVRYLSVFNGVTVKESVSRIMKEVVTNDLAGQYNLKGKKGKRSFASHQLMAVLYRCIQRNPSTKASPKKDLELEITKWLAGARDRHGGRMKRSAGMQMAAPQLPESDSDTENTTGQI